jgi:signal recognition particle subunit SRP54
LLERVKTRATGQDVLKSLTPAQAVIRVLRDEMIATLGSGASRLQLSSKIPAVVLMTGLQGSGKTTSSAKLALWLQKAGHHPLLVSTDVYRPAAREQLRSFATKAGQKVHHPEALEAPQAILESALQEARAVGHDVLIVDTAGRLHIDDDLMSELQQLKRVAEPSEILFVADAMTGQDAVKSALEFQTRIGITGIVLSKLDGDARGGAALSAASVTGKPIKFAGIGERAEEFEAFQPERMVSRILGMGDVLSLIEKVEGSVDREQAEALVKKLRKNEFTLEDFRDQLKMIRKMGPLESIMGMLPGMGNIKALADNKPDDKQMSRVEAIINSMTPDERRKQHIINGSRRKRIARGSGTSVEEVNRLLKQFVQMRKMLKQLGAMQGGGKGMRGAMKALRGRF